MAIKVGDIVCLKTTGELAYVLRTGLGETGNQILVRRPTMGKTGILHYEDGFFEGEVETPEQHLRREFEDHKLKTSIQLELQKAIEAQENDVIEFPKKGDLAVN